MSKHGKKHGTVRAGPQADAMTLEPGVFEKKSARGIARSILRSACVSERIKSTPHLAAIPVVMMSGDARLDTLVRSMEAGAADFIVKPFSREALLTKLGKYLRAGPEAPTIRPT